MTMGGFHANMMGEGIINAYRRVERRVCFRSQCNTRTIMCGQWWLSQERGFLTGRSWLYRLGKTSRASHGEGSRGSPQWEGGGVPPGSILKITPVFLQSQSFYAAFCNLLKCFFP